MMSKVGRNDPCPCGSKKKYKRRCLDKKDEPTKIKQSNTTVGSQFDEEYAISEILRSSKAFSNFYMAERIQIAGTINWVQDLSLPKGIDYRKTTYSSGKRFIYLRRIPAPLEDAVSIAHELQHFILEDKGFPSVGCAKRQYERQYKNLASALNSMVHDPLVDIQLQTYDFDLYEKYEKEISKRNLQEYPKSPPEHIGRVLWAINYASNVVDWELVRAEGDKDVSELQSLYDERFPDIAEMGQELLALVRRIGYDTPEKEHELFKEVIQKYKLSGYLIIGYPRMKGK